MLRTSYDGDNQTLWIELPSISSDSMSGHTLLPRSHVSSFTIGDKVIGIVQKKTGEQFFVNIGCGSLATLHYLAFEGSSKKTKPDVKVGDVLYASVRSGDIDMEVELQCIDENGKSKDFGVVGRLEPGVVGNSGSTQGGLLLTCSRQTVMKLLDKQRFPLLEKLSETYSYEVYLGVNGAIWLNCKSPKDIQIIANAIILSQYVSSSQCLEYASSLV
ncbi:Exosome component 3 [Cichlidogyrus casuarinus]|uniref:Ribosomal RNA-processing protein 40 n=1 Tax=Cichlidogyrus casuarinus TaxID=1844966 RepID=A0ABD2QP51_9PLAT